MFYAFFVYEITHSKQKEKLLYVSNNNPDIRLKNLDRFQLLPKLVLLCIKIGRTKSRPLLLRNPNRFRLKISLR